MATGGAQHHPPERVKNLAHWLGTRWLILLVVVTCVVMGLANALRLGPPFGPPSWVALYAYVPFTDVLYPAFFVVAGAFAAIGLWHTDALRLSYCLVFGLFVIWGGVGLVLTALGQPGGNVQGSLANFLCAGAYLTLAQKVGESTRSDATNVEVAKLTEQVREFDGR